LAASRRRRNTKVTALSCRKEWADSSPAA